MMLGKLCFPMIPNYCRLRGKTVRYGIAVNNKIICPAEKMVE